MAIPRTMTMLMTMQALKIGVDETKRLKSDTLTLPIV
jgi:hypothetical protein